MQKLVSKLSKLSTFSTLVLALVAMLAAVTVQAQGTPLPVELLPLGKDIGITQGQTVTPAYEGWYENEDGTIALSFGYYNRNSEELLDIPVGSANRILGVTESDQGQPTHFLTGRHWGVFTVDVPAGSGEDVVWHLESQGKTFHIPANLSPDYVIDAIVGDANNNFPPQIRFQENGPIGHGPRGITTGPVQAKVGEPLSIDAWVSDDGKVSGIAAMFITGSGMIPPVSLDWFKHQGPGEVVFSTGTTRVPSAGEKVNTEVTFSEAGDYMLRARITEATGAAMSGHSQCCWTNSFIKVNVNN